MQEISGKLPHEPMIELKVQLTQEKLLDCLAQTRENGFGRYQVIPMAEIAFGSKHVKLHLTKGGIFSCHITADPEVEHQTSETTRCYALLLKTLQDIADELRQPVKYMFTTSEPTMKDWFENKSRSIFHWEREEVDSGQLSAWCTVQPKV